MCVCVFQCADVCLPPLRGAACRVRGVKGLRVVDFSVLPAVISGNSHAPTVMIAEKASDIIKEDWSR